MLGRDQVFTAAHVAVGTTCTDVASGSEGRVVYRDPALDIATVQFPAQTLPEKIHLRYSCEGFEAGKTYYAIGYRRGRELVITRLTAAPLYDDRSDPKSGTEFNHVRLLNGDITPGMSGGPIVDERGVMVGTNQAMNYGGVGWSREIKDTYLCKAGTPAAL